MQNEYEFRQMIDPNSIPNTTTSVTRWSRALSISLLLFIASPNHAFAYGGHHGYSYGHSYGHHGHGRHGHYSHHGGIGVAGYVLLGVLSFAVITSVLNNNNDNYKPYRKSRTYNQPVYRQPTPYIPPASRKNILIEKPVTKTVYVYSEDAGWDWLVKGNADYALDIFAVQTQQNLNSGIPKIGFALAVASNGEMERATRAMRKAVRIDAAALDIINSRQIESTLADISENYRQSLSNHQSNPDTAFMLATLAYLQKDYTSARKIILENDHSQSANNLRKLIRHKAG